MRMSSRYTVYVASNNPAKALVDMRLEYSRCIGYKASPETLYAGLYSRRRCIIAVAYRLMLEMTMLSLDAVFHSSLFDPDPYRDLVRVAIVDASP